MTTALHTADLGGGLLMRVLDLSGSGIGPHVSLTADALVAADGSIVISPSAPARRLEALTAAMLSDTTDLETPTRALRVYNGSSADITLMVTGADDATDVGVPVIVPAGQMSVESLSVRRVWSTGSTGLADGIAAGTVSVTLLR